MPNKTTIGFGSHMIARIIKASDNTTIDNSRYHAQPHPIFVK